MHPARTCRHCDTPLVQEQTPCPAHPPYLGGVGTRCGYCEWPSFHKGVIVSRVCLPCTARRATPCACGDAPIIERQSGGWTVHCPECLDLDWEGQVGPAVSGVTLREALGNWEDAAERERTRGAA